jgi:hypothetical protein
MHQNHFTPNEPFSRYAKLLMELRFRKVIHQKALLLARFGKHPLHATLGYMTPATWHRGQPEEVRNERARRIAAARAHRKMTNQQRFTEAA